MLYRFTVKTFRIKIESLVHVEAPEVEISGSVHQEKKNEFRENGL